jgi:hypothetical protein
VAKLGRLIPEHVWRSRYLRKGFGRFAPLRLVERGSGGESRG